MAEETMINWVIDGELARGCRPGRHAADPHNVGHVEVEQWITEAQRKGVRSIICLLSTEQLAYYPGVDLLAEYERHGFVVRHIPVDDYQYPPLSVSELKMVWAAYQDLPRPVLVHCSAGVDRTGYAINHILRQLSSES